MSERHINQAGLDLIKRFEGLKLRAYRCPAGVWTVGFGSTKGVTKGMVITLDEAEKRLREDLKEAEEVVEQMVHVSLSDNEFAALTSFTFNLGATALAKSTLLRKLNTGDRQGSAQQFARWNKAGKPLRVLIGLIRRRAAEADLFQTPICLMEFVV